MTSPELDPAHPVHVCPLCRKSNRGLLKDLSGHAGYLGGRQDMTLTVTFHGQKSGGWPNHTSSRFCMPCGRVVVDLLLEKGYLQHPIEP